jgi:hypothetical protein
MLIILEQSDSVRSGHTGDDRRSKLMGISEGSNAMDDDEDPTTDLGRG